MGDVSSEPTMEEILSSIKRVIEESETPAGNSRTRRGAPRPIVSPNHTADLSDDDDDAVLELSERAPFPAAEALPRRDAVRPATTVRTPDVAPPQHAQSEASHAGLPQSGAAATAPTQPAQRADAIVSPGVAEASRGPLEALSRMIVRPDAAGSDTLEGMVREMLRPMLREWLDANLPNMVEAMVAKEIARISGRGL